MQINPIFSSFLAVENIELDNKTDLIKWAKEEINFDGTTNYKSTGSNHLNIDEKASTSLEIDMGINEVPKDMVLIMYALYNQLIKIDHLRQVSTAE